MNILFHEYVILGLLSLFIIAMCVAGFFLTNQNTCDKNLDKPTYNALFSCTITIASAFCFSVLLTFLLKFLNLSQYEIYIRVLILVIFLLVVTIFVQRLKNKCKAEDSEYILGMSYLIIVLSCLYTFYSVFFKIKQVNIPTAVPVNANATF